MSGEYKETLTIHFIKKDGQVQDVRVPIGMTLMMLLVCMQNLLLMKCQDCGNQSLVLVILILKILTKGEL